ncbi:unnamed protein product [Ranitomeya imitator]|uniref:Uncharacterized protein n=1 Tax=Ranitomeya imitator TaxID=111125 RepID=A0ABN9KY35_9NEOB|nr:unnamed protein product [Ranitomeya imitator]
MLLNTRRTPAHAREITNNRGYSLFTSVDHGSHNEVCHFGSFINCINGESNIETNMRIVTSQYYGGQEHVLMENQCKCIRVTSRFVPSKEDPNEEILERNIEITVPLSSRMNISDPTSPLRTEFAYNLLSLCKNVTLWKLKLVVNQFLFLKEAAIHLMRIPATLMIETSATQLKFPSH